MASVDMARLRADYLEVIEDRGFADLYADEWDNALEAHDRTERAAAWDEGYDAGCNDEAFEARGISSDPGSKEYPRANPYRERGDGA